MNAIAKCGKCKVIFADEIPDDPCRTQPHEPCPLCGSTTRIVDVGPMDELVNYEEFRFRQSEGRTQDKGSIPPFEVSDRHKVARVVDRPRDCYYQLVTVRGSGEILFEFSQPLSTRAPWPSPPNENISQDQIAVAAYYLWEAEGHPDGRDRDHWEAATRQLQQHHNPPDERNAPLTASTRTTPPGSASRSPKSQSTPNTPPDSSKNQT